MTIGIERQNNTPVWYRTADSNDPWTELVATYAQMLPGQNWELSQDGENAKGTIYSLEDGHGGKWSGFMGKVHLHEVRRLGTTDVYVHGK